MCFMFHISIAVIICYHKYALSCLQGQKMLAFSMAVAVNSLVKYALCLYFCYWRLIMSVLLMQKNSLFLAVDGLDGSYQGYEHVIH
jgi:hypothetical protein